MKKEKKDFGKNKSANTTPIDSFNRKHPQKSSTHHSQTNKKDQDYSMIFCTITGKKKITIITTL